MKVKLTKLPRNLFIYRGIKSEPVLDINELKSMGLSKNIAIGETISVLLEKIEDKNGDVIVSASKAQKIKGWDKLVEAYEKKNQSWEKSLQSAKEDVLWNIWIQDLYVFTRFTN